MSSLHRNFPWHRVRTDFFQGANLMSSSPVPAESAAPVTKPLPAESDKPAATSRGSDGWKKYVTPLLVVALALAVLITITRNWNAWEGGKVEQVTDDAYVRGDLTPLSTKVAGIVRTVEAARAAIVNNRRQRELQDSRIAKALAGIDQAKAQIAAAEAGKEAVQAQLVRARSERKRQEGLYQAHSATQQTLEAAVANDDQLSAQLVSRDADLNQAQTMLRSSELSAEAERRSKAVLESQDMQLQADLHAKQASLAAATVNLGYTKIYAPGDGTVGERQVRTGQLVSPGTQVIAFVDITKWVLANYRETQLTNVKIGDAAELRIDQYPGQVLHGKVLEIAPASGSQFSLLPPDNATGNFTKVVQRIPVKIALDDSDFAAKLRPGLSVIATVRTRR